VNGFTVILADLAFACRPYNDRGHRMTCFYDGFDIESFEAAKGLWHARIRRAALSLIAMDGVLFPSLEIGFARSDPESAIADAKHHIDRFRLRDDMDAQA
jgi:hypothetical protein